MKKRFTLYFATGCITKIVETTCGNFTRHSMLPLMQTCMAVLTQDEAELFTHAGPVEIASTLGPKRVMFASFGLQ